MRLQILLCVSLASVTATPARTRPLIPSHPKVAHYEVHQGQWRLEIARDTFSDEVACRLQSRNKRMIYRAGAVGFHFNCSWNVKRAAYRLDGGAPASFRDDRPQLAALGVPMDRGGSDNASDGIVWIPYDRLADAKSVAIEARPGHAARRFRLDGLVALYAIAEQQGCTPDNHFVER